MIQFIPTGSYRITDLEPPPWLRSRKLDVDVLGERGRAGLTPMAKQILNDMRQDPTSLSSKAYWMPFVESGLCLAAAMDEAASLGALDNLTTETPAGVYLIVGCEGDRVSTLYVGQSWDVLQRTVQHRICYEDTSVAADKAKRLVYNLLQNCDQVFHFRLAHTVYDDREVRTTMEGLWCLVLGTFQHKAV